MASDLPLVHVVIPVYNGADHLQECLESVLAQGYPRWRATVVNNCSTDATGAIAETLAARDPRLRVMHCTEFLSQGDNYNRAVGVAAQDAAYVKVVEADNWIARDSLERAVAVAEANARVGVVSGYAMQGRELLGAGVDPARDALSGPEVWRLTFDERRYLLGTPTTLLFRSAALRELPTWFDSTIFYDDVDLCFRILRRWELGFVHAVVGFIRTDNDGTFSKVEDLDYWDAYLHLLAQDYAQDFMPREDVDRFRRRIEHQYYRRLARAAVSGRRRDYWSFNLRTLRARGRRIRPGPFAFALGAELLDRLLNPKATVERLLKGR